MKNKFLAILGVVLLLGFTSCTKWINPEINKDPDAITEAPMDLLLSSVEVNLGYVFGDFDVAGVTSIWMQQIKGTDRQALAINGYNLTQADVNNLWNDIYTGPLMDIKDIKTQAQASKADNYYGVAEILEALTLGTMTGLFGDIPYSDALNGYPPTYDSEEQIYNTVQSLLDDAISKIDPNGTINNDVIYSGHLDMWVKAAYTLKARFALRISNVKTPSWTDIISWVDKGLQPGEALAEPFGVNAVENNPMYQFLTQRSGYAADNETFQSFLADSTSGRWGAGNSDPRNGVLFLGDDQTQGPLTQPNSPVYLITGVEGQFIKAEAYYHAGNIADARTTLVNAVQAAMAMLNLSPDMTAYTAYVAGLSGDALLGEIITQKWVANFLNPETWADYRRTGYPHLTPTTGTKIPNRFPYPTDETSYNPNTPDYGSIFNPLWFEGSSK